MEHIHGDLPSTSVLFTIFRVILTYAMSVNSGFKKKTANSTLSDKFSIFRSSIAKRLICLWERWGR